MTDDQPGQDRLDLDKIAPAMCRCGHTVASHVRGEFGYGCVGCTGPTCPPRALSSVPDPQEQT